MNKIFIFCAMLFFLTMFSCGRVRKEVALGYAHEAEAIIAQGGDTLAALRLYDRAIALYPLYPMFFYNRGLIRENLGDSIGGLEDFRRSIEIDPTFEAGYWVIGLALYDKGKYLEAISYFEKLLYLSPTALMTYYGLGLAYYRLGKFERAIYNFKRFDELDKSNRDSEWTNYYLGLS